VSIDSVARRIQEIQERIGGIQHRVQEVQAGRRQDAGGAAEPWTGGSGRFGQALDRAAKPVEAQTAPVAAPQAPLPPPTTPPATGIGALVSDAATRNQLDPALLRAVMQTESAGNPNATSPVGAMGLMQLMPGTAKDLGVQHPYDPVENLQGGAKYLSELTQRFGLKDGVAAYNAGPGAVQAFGGVPPYRETQHYVNKVLSLYNEFKKPESQVTK
jgi:soluble lytic murein transglycosylase-like protein